ncbi:PASTA domain-containing protein [Paenibacillus alginolyticus]|uniref:PASTA domain-containing protein n=1 Tax=Paenibacillus alginolyticus TaxID=59839 RepID=A0ABT4GC03_9BACL|nr:PASTA domain-containing protein [Paenibacillus alginolyticus]MCY9693672.1 PASTA domain-containing protein [Paenibacillus alginolyticus]MEC0145599.1 PASTA domain-containing protein [Paenibacillus alginolyticus]
MHKKMGTRYVPDTQIAALPHGTLKYGDDLFLTRKVLLYQIELQPGQVGEDYIRTLHHKAAFIHDGFQHILDTSVEEDSVTIILQAKTGSLFSNYVNRKEMSFPTIIAMIADLGVSLLDAMEERITGFTVGAENLWLDDHGKLSVINYWDKGDPQAQGAIGLCRLMIQLFTGSETITGAFEVMHTHLERTPIPSATYEQKLALIKLIKLVCQGHASLSSLIFGLRSLPSSGQKQDAGPIPKQIHYQNPSKIQNHVVDESEEEEDEDEVNEAAPAADKRSQSLSALSKAGIGAIAILVVVLVTVWALWPSSEVEPVVVAPIPTATPLTPTNSPVPSTTKPLGDSNKQSQEVVIPNLVGLSQADAEAQALAAGLHYNFLIEANDKPKGTVIKQDPTSGTKGLQGDNVTFWVSKGNQ